MLLKYRKAIHSESRKGNPYDNAFMESFYKTIKRELIQDAHYETPEQAQKEIFKYIELYIIRNVCIQLLDIVLQLNSKKKIHKIYLTLCLQNLDISKS